MKLKPAYFILPLTCLNLAMGPCQDESIGNLRVDGGGDASATTDNDGGTPAIGGRGGSDPNGSGGRGGTGSGGTPATGGNGGATVPSVPEIIALTDNPVDLAVDGSFVYWTGYGDHVRAATTGMALGHVSKVAKAGGPVIQLAGSQVNPFHIAVDEASVYWTVSGSKPPSATFPGYAAGAVRKVSLAGGAPQEIFSSAALPAAISLHGGYVYWLLGSSVDRWDGVVRDMSEFKPEDWGLWRARIDGTNVQRMNDLVGHLSHHIAISGGIGYYGFAGPVDSNRGGVYAVDLNTPRSVGDPRPILYEGALGIMPADVAVGGSSLFVSALNDGKILSIPLAGGTPTPITTFPFSDNHTLTTDGQNVYFIAGPGQDVLMKAPFGGGSATVVAYLKGVGKYLAVDATHVYVTGGDVINKGTISRVPK